MVSLTMRLLKGILPRLGLADISWRTNKKGLIHRGPLELCFDVVLVGVKQAVSCSMESPYGGDRGALHCVPD